MSPTMVRMRMIGSDRAKASRMLGLLQTGQYVPAVLTGPVRIPLSTWRDDVLDEGLGLPAQVRISYNPTVLDGRAIVPSSFRRTLTTRKRVYAEVDAPAVFTLDNLMREAGLAMTVEVRWEDGAPFLAVPDDDDLDELIRLLRLHRAWPVPEDVLANQYRAERLYAALRADAGVEIEYGDSRHSVPDFLRHRPFWVGVCRAAVEVPPRSARHVPVARLLHRNTTVLTAKPSRPAYPFLSAHDGQAVDAVSVSILDGERRKPRTRLILLGR